MEHSYTLEIYEEIYSNLSNNNNNISTPWYWL
jgi:hypothetical protein